MIQLETGESMREYALTFLNLQSHISSESILEFTTEALWYVKEDFFWQPASSSGKYHPSYSLGIGGLLRHTKAAILIAKELFAIHEFNQDDQDYIIAALALHDTEKPSKLHPVEVKLRLEPLKDKFPRILEKVIPLIESHMGQWNNFGKLPKPTKRMNRFVHLCDYLASRKNLTVNVMSDLEQES